MKASPGVIPDGMSVETEMVVNPPPAETMPLAKVKTSTVKTMVSLKGKIVYVTYPAALQITLLKTQ